MAKSRKVWIVVVAALVGVAVIYGVVGNITRGDEPRDAVAETATATPEPTTEVDEPAVEEVEPDLAARTEEALLANLGGIEKFHESPGSPLYAIASLEDMYDGTIRIHYQEAATDEERDTIARHVFNFTTDIEDLDTVVIRDTSGVDSNHYR